MEMTKRPDPKMIKKHVEMMKKKEQKGTIKVTPRPSVPYGMSKYTA